MWNVENNNANTGTSILQVVAGSGAIVVASGTPAQFPCHERTSWHASFVSLKEAVGTKCLVGQPIRAVKGIPWVRYAKGQNEERSCCSCCRERW